MNMNLVEEYKRKINIVKRHLENYGADRLHNYVVATYGIEESISAMEGKGYILSLPFGCKLLFRVIDNFDEVNSISIVEGKPIFHVVKHYIFDIGLVDMCAKELCNDLEFYEYQVTESHLGIETTSSIISEGQCRDIINKLLKDIDTGVELRIRNW